MFRRIRSLVQQRQTTLWVLLTWSKDVGTNHLIECFVVSDSLSQSFRENDHVFEILTSRIELNRSLVSGKSQHCQIVVIPQTLGYDVAMTLQPQPDNFQDLRSLESIVKNPNRDASLLMDVQLERIKSKR